MRWNKRGFGFIQPDEGGEDLFCHHSQIEDGNALAQGATVHFVKQWDDQKGKDRAVQVKGGLPLLPARWQQRCINSTEHL